MQTQVGSTLRTAYGLVDGWTRRRALAFVVVSVALALVELIALAALYLLLSVLARPDFPPSGTAGRFVTAVGLHTRSTAVDVLGPATVLLLLGRTLLSSGAIRRQNRFVASAEARLASRQHRDYLVRDLAFHRSKNSVVLVRRLLASVPAVTTNIIGSSLMIAADLSSGAAVVVALLVASPVVAACLVAYTALVVVGILVFISPAIRSSAGRDFAVGQVGLQSLQEAYEGVRALHAFDVVEPVATSFGVVRAEMAVTRAQLLNDQRLPGTFLEVSLVVGVAGAAVMLSLAGPDEAVGTLGLLVAGALRVLPSVTRILSSTSSILSAQAPMASLLKDRVPAVEQAEQAVPPLRRSIHLQGVAVRYPGSDVDAVAGLDLVIEAGTSVGIVGPSGAGKTTLLDVLLGLVTPTAGKVLVDGEALVPAALRQWRQQIGFVPQDTFLLDGSVRDNVLFHRALPADGDDAVWAALDQAQLGALVRSLPDGLGTQVGQRGSLLSGGQRQRLGLARALLLRPAVLVLDEATSALDSVTERAVADTLALLGGTMTTVVVAHRLSTVQSCDQLVMLDAGTVRAKGTFDELYASQPAFARAVDLGNALPSSFEPLGL